MTEGYVPDPGLKFDLHASPTLRLNWCEAQSGAGMAALRASSQGQPGDRPGGVAT